MHNPPLRDEGCHFAVCYSFPPQRLSPVREQILPCNRRGRYGARKPPPLGGGGWGR